MPAQPVSTVRSNATQASALAALLSRAVAVATFNRNGTVTAAEISDPLPVHRPGRIALWYCRLATAASADTTVELRLNSTTVTTTLIPAGELTSAVTEILGPTMVPFDDELRAYIASTGSGATGFVGLAVVV